MALDEEQSSAGQEMRRAIDCLRDCAALAEVDSETLEALAAGAVHFSLPAGWLLFESGSTPEGVYLLASGRLGVDTPGNSRLTAEIERSELVGETGWLLKEQRSATVVALRDSELLLLPMALLDTMAAQSTRFCLALARFCARRLRRSNRHRPEQRQARVFAIVPNSVEIDIANFATRLVAEFTRAAARNWCGMRAPARTRRAGSTPSRNPTTTWCMWPTPVPAAGPTNAAARRM